MSRRTFTRAAAALLALAVPAGAAAADSAAKIIKKLSKEKDSEMREVLVGQLGAAGGPAAVEGLMGVLAADPIASVRADACYELKEMKEAARPAVPAFKQALRDEAPYVRSCAAHALWDLKAATSAEVAPPLGTVVVSGDDQMARLALKMLMNIGLQDEHARRELLNLLRTAPAPTRSDVVVQLSRLRRFDLSAGPWVRELATAAAEVATTDGDARVREQAVRWLGKFNPPPPEVVKALMAALDDNDPKVSLSAAMVLNGIDPDSVPQRAVGHLLDRIKTGPTPQARANAATTLAGLRGHSDQWVEAVSRIVAADKDATVRAACASILGEAGQEAAAAPLMAALKGDGDWKVRAAAAASIGAIHPNNLTRTGKLDLVKGALKAAEADTEVRVREAAEEALKQLGRP
jgi:HEAT repeat protein